MVPRGRFRIATEEEIMTQPRRSNRPFRLSNPKCRHRAAHSRNRFRKLISNVEQLEVRNLLATACWAAPVSGNWSDASKWDTGFVPGAGDHACIDKTGANYTVTLNTNVLAASALGSFTLNSPNATFFAGANIFNVNGPSLVNSGNVTWNDSTWTGNASSSLSNAGSISVRGMSTISTNSFSQNGAVTINGDGAGFGTHSTLTVATGFTNSGTISLQNINGIDGSSNLAVTSGALVNSVTGVINSNVGTGGPRMITADITNNGTLNIHQPTKFAKNNSVLNNNANINVHANTLFVGTNYAVNNSGNFNSVAGAITFGTGSVFTQADGILNLGGSFTTEFDTFNFNGGALSGNEPVLAESALLIGAGSTGAGTFSMRGVSSTLSGNVAQAQTIKINGGGGLHATLTAAAGFTNSGTITLEDIGATGSSNLVVTSGTLVNAATGVINSNVGLAGLLSTIAANINNDGTVNFNHTTTLTKTSGVLTNNNTVNIAAARTLLFGNGSVFTQAGGTLNVAGGFAMDGDTFNFNGGALSGNMPVLGASALNIGPGSVGAGTFSMRGISTLSGNVAQAQTILVNSTGLHDTLTAATGFTNNGNIALENVAGAAGSSNLTVTSGILLNAATGVLNSNTGTGGGRTITAQLDNQGTLNVRTATTLVKGGAAHSNSGAVHLHNTNLIVNGASFTNAAAGLIDGNGTLNVSSAPFSNQGTVAPGLSPGSLTIQGNYPETASGHLAIEIGGTSAGTQYDQLVVNGTVSLAGALDVDVINGFTPSVGNQFVIIGNDGTDAVSGTFAGLPEGSLLIVDGSGFVITYKGGSNTNDVVLSSVTVPSISIDNVTAVETDSGTSTITLNVTLSSSSSQTVTVNYSTADVIAQDDNPASEDSDYVPVSGSLTFVPGDTIEPITITISGDTLPELDETITVNLSSPLNATIADGLGVAKILNDDPTPATPNTNLNFTPITVATETGPGAGGSQVLFGPAVAHGLLFYVTQHNTSGVVQLKFGVDPVRISQIVDGTITRPIGTQETFVVDQFTLPLDPGESSLAADFAAIQIGGAIGTYLQSDGKYRIVLPYRVADTPPDPQILHYATIIVNGNTIESIQSKISADQAASFPMVTNGRHIAYVTHPNNELSELRIYDIDTATVHATGVVQEFGVGGIDPYMSLDGNILAFGSTEYSDVNPANYRDYNLDGDTNDRLIRWIDVDQPTVVHIGPTIDDDKVVNNSPILLGTDGRYIAYTLRESGSSLNNDADAADDVIFLFDTVTSMVTNGSGAVSDFASDPSAGIVVFNTRDGGEGMGSDFNGDGDFDDFQLRFFDINTNPNRLITTNVTLQDFDSTLVHNSAGTGHSDGVIIGYRYQPGVNDAFNPNAAEIRFIRISESVGPNQGPTAEAGGPYSAGEGGTVGLDGSGSSDPDQPANTLAYEWDLDGDNVFGESGGAAARGDENLQNPTFLAAGLDGPTTFTVKLRVLDNQNALSAIDEATVNVANVPPSFEAGADAIIPASAAGAFSRTGITFTDPGTLDVHEVTVNFGDSTGNQTSTLVVGDRDFDLNHTYATSGTYTVTVTVKDDDTGSHTDTFQVTIAPPVIQFSVASFQDSEGAGNSTVVTLTKTGGSQSNSVVQVSITGGSATGSTDYDNSSFPLTVAFGPMETTKTVTVPITQENFVELDETIHFEIIATTNAAIGAQSTTTLTILNEDRAVLNLNSVSGNEDAGPLTFTATLTNPVDVTVTAQGNSADGSATTADNDYTPLAAEPISIAAGSLSDTFSVSITADNKVELDELFDVLLSNLSAGGRNVTLGSNVVGTILNDDAALVTVSDVSLAEGNAGTAVFTFTVNLSNPASKTVTVSYATADGTAQDNVPTTDDDDYQPANGMLMFLPGVTSQQITVLVNGDLLSETNETFFVNLSDAKFDGLSDANRVSIADSQGRGTIVNDDSAGQCDATIQLVGGVLEIHGTDGKDIVVVKRVGGSQIKVSANLSIPSGSDGGADHFYFDLADVDSVHMVLCGGSDHANIGNDGGSVGGDGGADWLIPSLVEGGDGNDYLTGGGGHDTLLGGAGNDNLHGRHGDDILLGGGDDDDLNGGNGQDTLVGGDGNDKVSGGQGQDVLIGGRDKDELTGNQGDDLLIGGFTLFDNQISALQLIMAEWSSSRDYNTRVTNLREGTGPVLTGTGVKLKASGSGRTVFDDGAKDTLQADDGQDWFFADIDGTGGDDDKVKDEKGNELLDIIFDLP
jgi:hypothetical protein